MSSYFDLVPRAIQVIKDDYIVLLPLVVLTLLVITVMGQENTPPYWGLSLIEMLFNILSISFIYIVLRYRTCHVRYAFSLFYSRFMIIFFNTTLLSLPIFFLQPKLASVEMIQTLPIGTLVIALFILLPLTAMIHFLPIIGFFSTQPQASCLNTTFVFLQQYWRQLLIFSLWIVFISIIGLSIAAIVSGLFPVPISQYLTVIILATSKTVILIMSILFYLDRYPNPKIQEAEPESQYA